jgi:WS/DGAT/MGAT family acyltransferase
MAYSHYERLTALDGAFLELEDANVSMSVGAVALFEAAPLRSDEGVLDIERICAFVESALQHSPRFRQRLAWTPGFRHPVWIDDARFNLSYHVRHTALPPPGDLRQLKRLAGRIFSQKLDRGKPLWEMWFVEGVEEDRFAVIVKAHHCMVDGIAGIDLLAGIMRLDPDPTVPPSKPWIARAAPSERQLFVDELAHRASLPLSLVGAGLRAVRHPAEAIDELGEAARSLLDTVAAGLKPTASTPLNPDLGPYRRFDWTRCDLRTVKEARRHLGGTLNDAVLSVAAGAVGGFLRQRGVSTRDMTFRAMVPVSIRKPDQQGVAGNRVVNFLAQLPVDERDPVKRLAAVVETTRKLKRSRLVRGAEILEEISDRSFDSVVVRFVQLAARQRAFNLVVTNVPGPPRTAYLLGAKLQAIYPLVPLFENQGLGIALFSYDGGLYWGFNADWDALPDLHDFAGFVDLELEGLAKAAAEAAGKRDAAAEAAGKRDAAAEVADRRAT